MRHPSPRQVVLGLGCLIGADEPQLAGLTVSVLMPFASLDSTIFTFVPTATDGSTVVVTDFESSVKERVFFPTRTSIFLPASYSLTVPTTVWPLYFIVPSVVVTFFSSVFSIGLSCANAAEPPSKSTERTGTKNLRFM